MLARFNDIIYNNVVRNAVIWTNSTDQNNGNFYTLYEELKK